MIRVHDGEVYYAVGLSRIDADIMELEFTGMLLWLGGRSVLGRIWWHGWKN